MKNLKSIKVLRYDEKENVWSGHVIRNVFIAGFKEGYNLSDTMDKNVSQVMRVMKDIECDVKVSDRIVMMPYYGITPPDNALVVVSVTKNECGENTSHTKVLCR